jgi:hypothetical protein
MVQRAYRATDGAGHGADKRPREEDEVMAKKEKTHAGKLGDWKRLLAPLDENDAELGHLQVPKTKLAALLARAEELTKQQRALRASKQEASKELGGLIVEGDRLFNALRVMLREHYGIRSEKLAEFGMQPFRGRKAQSKPTPEQPTPEQPEVPAAAPPAAGEAADPAKS